MEPSLPWLVVGLGNPGPRYAGTRHNVGEKVARLLASRHDAGESRFKSHRARAVVDEVRLRVTSAVEPQRVVLAVPTTFMNDSGSAVAGLMKYYSVDLDQLIVVHDELDIPAGDVRVKKGGGEGGHNGLRSVSASLGSKDYLRVRVGIGRPPGRMDPADYVLRDFSSVERKELPLMLEMAADAVESLLEVGLLASQQRFHSP